MYEFIRGTLVSKDPTAAIVEAGGIGYRVLISTATFDRLGAVGEDAKLYLHFSFNAEQGLQRFYGFAEQRERQIFQQLLDVQRVGPASAMRILSNAGADALINAIAGGDVMTLKKVKGVGPKMAERLVIELQEPLSKLGMIASTSLPGAGGAPLSNVGQDAVAALVNLGIKPSEAEKTVAKASKKLGPDAELEEVIRLALQGG